MSNYVEITENNRTIRISNEEYLRRMKTLCKKISSSKELTQEFMIKAGIHTEDGELAPQYR